MLILDRPTSFTEHAHFDEVTLILRIAWRYDAMHLTTDPDLLFIVVWLEMLRKSSFPLPIEYEYEVLWMKWTRVSSIVDIASLAA